MSSVRFGVPLFPYDRWGGIGPIGEAARQAESLGFAALTFPDHVVMPTRPGVPPVSAVWYDPFVLGAHLATLTERIRLVYNVLVVPYRPPVQLAKAVSTLDMVSNGRVTLGVGAGWIKGEFRVLGIPYAERGPLTDEYLRAMRVLWTEDEPHFEGETVRFGQLAFEPRCVQRPHVPLWIGGSGPRNMRRVVELGDGWTPMVGNLEELRTGADWIREQLAARGRDVAGFAFCYGVNVGERDPERDRARSHAAGADLMDRRADDSPQAAIDRVGALAEIGFRDVTLSFKWESPADYRDRLEWLARARPPRLRLASPRPCPVRLSRARTRDRAPGNRRRARSGVRTTA